MEKRGRGDALFRNLNRDDSVWTSAQLPQMSPLAKAQAKAAAKTVTAVTKTSAASAKSKSAQAFGEFGGMFFSVRVEFDEEISRHFCWPKTGSSYLEV